MSNFIKFEQWLQVAAELRVEELHGNPIGKELLVRNYKKQLKRRLRKIITERPTDVVIEE